MRTKKKRVKSMCKAPFLLAIDVGNTTIHFGLFQREKLTYEFRLSTNLSRTVDEYAAFVDVHLRRCGVSETDVCHVLVCSVVPPVDKPLTEMVRQVLKKDAIHVKVDDFPMPVRYEAKKEIGADRLVDALAAYALYGKKKRHIVVVDFGTATTFDVIHAKGKYLGGAIAPGVEISLDALFKRAAKLPRVDILKPKRVIGRNTEESLHAGVFFGFVVKVDGMLSLIEKEIGGKIWGVATGGLAPQIAPECKKIQVINTGLTLYGLHVLHSTAAF